MHCLSANQALPAVAAPRQPKLSASEKAAAKQQRLAERVRAREEKLRLKEEERVC